MPVKSSLCALVLLAVLLPVTVWSDDSPAPSATPSSSPSATPEAPTAPAVQTPTSDRHLVDHNVLLTASSICPDSEDGKTLCQLRVRLDLAMKAAPLVSKQAKQQNMTLTAEQLPAIADAILLRQVLSEEHIVKSGTKMVAVTMAGRLSPDKLKSMLNVAQKNAQLIAAAKSQYDRVQAQVAQLKQKALSSEDSVRDTVRARMAEAQEQKKEMLMDMLVASNVIAEGVTQGMSPDDVQALAGAPRSVTSDPSGEFLCFNYGRAWVVFENGAAACLRKRLEYKRNYGSNCHCAGSMQSFIDFAQ